MSLPETLRDIPESRGADTHSAAAAPRSQRPNWNGRAKAGGMIRCVQTGRITQGRFDGHGIYLPCGVWAWSIDGRYVPGKLIDQHPKPPRPPALPQRSTISEVAA